LHSCAPRQYVCESEQVREREQMEGGSERARRERILSGRLEPEEKSRKAITLHWIRSARSLLSILSGALCCALCYVFGENDRPSSSHRRKVTQGALLAPGLAFRLDAACSRSLRAGARGWLTPRNLCTSSSAAPARPAATLLLRSSLARACSAGRRPMARPGAASCPRPPVCFPPPRRRPIHTLNRSNTAPTHPRK